MYLQETDPNQKIYKRRETNNKKSQKHEFGGYPPISPFKDYRWIQHRRNLFNFFKHVSGCLRIPVIYLFLTLPVANGKSKRLLETLKIKSKSSRNTFLL